MSSYRSSFAPGHLPAESQVSGAGVARAAVKAGQWFVFGFLPLSIFCWWVSFSAIDPSGDWGFDFQQFWQGGRDVTHGVSPYPDAPPPASDKYDFHDVRTEFRFPYPAGAALAFAPFGVLGLEAASVVWGALIVASLVATVWILDVRDWRVAGVMLGSPAVIGAVRPGTVTPVLMLLLATAWRWRDRRWVAAGSLGAAIALKIFLWPLVFWLVATRRFAAAAYSAALAATITCVAWAVIGFDGLGTYPELVRNLAASMADRGYSLVALGAATGLPGEAERLLPWLVGVPLLALAPVVARGEDGDRRAFSVTIVASLALTPIVWLHYFALLVVPLCLARPRLAWAWGAMWLLWLTPGHVSHGDVWRIALGTAVMSAVLVVSVRARERSPACGRATVPSTFAGALRPRAGSVTSPPARRRRTA
ncbi:MAG: DUF2029 domain-containing protein [Gaiella sp.]|nr:DUF2029 domain-containing protein [Gaiella sp.]